MSEHLHQELRELAEWVNACPDDDVADFGGCIARIYKRERMAVLGIIGINALVSGVETPHDEFDPRLVACRERMRDRLRGLLAWAQRTGRV